MSSTVLRWAGSKRWLTPLLLQLVPEYDRYFEPFLGAGHLFFALSPENAILSDLNASLIEAYDAIAMDPDRVIAIASALKPTRDEYYMARDSYKRLRNPIKRGAYFLYLNRLCWNGLYRQNKAGHFNVPFGRPKAPRRGPILDWQRIHEASNILKNASIRHCDFRSVTALARTNDFLYLDPPYVLGRKGRIFSEYTATAFTVEDEQRLASEAQRLSLLGAYVVVSHAFSKLVLDEYGAGFTALKLPRSQTIAGKMENRTQLNEVVLISNNLAERLMANVYSKATSPQVSLTGFIAPKGLQHRGQPLKLFAGN